MEPQVKLDKLHPRLVRLGWIYSSLNRNLTCRSSQVVISEHESASFLKIFLKMIN
ncbi:hypothetical protein HanRHA438_Chr05g0210121 [Helianthus annuus]|nr:hypothetical protein HanRHA438_Chr05g0210121 [Helianthus annuus]